MRPTMDPPSATASVQHHNTKDNGSSGSPDTKSLARSIHSTLASVWVDLQMREI